MPPRASGARQMPVREEQEQPEPQAQAEHRRPGGEPRRRPSAGQRRPAAQQRREGIVEGEGTEQDQQAGGTQQPANAVARPPADDHRADHRPGKEGRVDHHVDNVEDRHTGQGPVGAAEGHTRRPQPDRQGQHRPGGPGPRRSCPARGGTHPGQSHLGAPRQRRSISGRHHNGSGVGRVAPTRPGNVTGFVTMRREVPGPIHPVLTATPEVSTLCLRQSRMPGGMACVASSGSLRSRWWCCWVWPLSRR